MAGLLRRWFATSRKYRTWVSHRCCQWTRNAFPETLSRCDVCIGLDLWAHSCHPPQAGWSELQSGVRTLCIRRSPTCNRRSRRFRWSSLLHNRRTRCQFLAEACGLYWPRINVQHVNHNCIDRCVASRVSSSTRTRGLPWCDRCQIRRGRMAASVEQ